MSLLAQNAIIEQILPVWEAIKSRGDLSVFWAVFRGEFGVRYPAGTNQ